MKYFFMFIDYIPFFLAPLCIYYWRKYKEPLWGWLAIIQGIILLQRLWRYIKSFMDIDFQTKLILLTIDSLVSLILLISIIVVFYVFRERKITFKNNAGLKGFHGNSNEIPEYCFLNPEFRDFKDKEKYSYYLTIRIEFKNKDSKGLPIDKVTIKAIDSVEDEIDEKIKAVCNVYFVGKMMRNGYRYLYYYVSDDKKLSEQFASIKGPVDEDGVRFSWTLEKDDRWQKALEFFKNLKF